MAGLERGQESHTAPSHTLRPASLPSGCSGVGSVITIREVQEKCFPEFWELFRQITEPGKKAGRTARLRSAPQKGGETGHPRCGRQLQQGRILGGRLSPLEPVLTPGGRQNGTELLDT